MKNGIRFANFPFWIPAVSVLVGGGFLLLLSGRSVADPLPGKHILNRPVLEKTAATILPRALPGTLSRDLMPYLSEISFIAPVFGPSLQNALDRGQIADTTFEDPKALQVFYESRSKAPFWTVNDQSYGQARRVLDLLEKSWTHGLNPQTYHVERLKYLLGRTLRTRQAELELLLSDAVVRYGRDLTGMRVPAGKLGLRTEDWRQPLNGIEVLGKIARASDPAFALEDLAPKSALYGALRHELVTLARTGDLTEYEPISFRGYLLHPNENHRSVPALRARLEVRGENPESRKYDPALVKAVEQFQTRNGLDADGIVGAKTLDAINRTDRDRIRQILANLERIRWLKDETEDRYIVVNIPSAMLWAIENGKVKHEMRVVVGRNQRRTKSFRTEIVGVRLNPSWTVPHTLKQHDYLPQLRQDPYALYDHEIEVFRGENRNAAPIDPASVNWNAVSGRDMHGFRLVQPPGPNNPLGAVRILMPNPYNIYLHDTNHKDYFKRSVRTLSSGCVRVSDPKAVADFVMAGTENWSRGRMNALIDTGKTRDFRIEKRIPVSIIYQTMWLTPKGALVYDSDVYGYDEKLVALLDSSGETFIPERKERIIASGESGTYAKAAHYVDRE